MWHLRFFGTQFAVLALLSFMGSQAALAGYPASSEFSMNQSQEARGLDGSFQVAVMGSSTSPLDIPTETFPKKAQSEKPVIEKPQVTPPAVEKPKANSKKASKPKKKKVKTANVKKAPAKKSAPVVVKKEEDGFLTKTLKTLVGDDSTSKSLEKKEEGLLTKTLNTLVGDDKKDEKKAVSKPKKPEPQKVAKKKAEPEKKEEGFLTKTLKTLVGGDDDKKKSKKEETAKKEVLNPINMVPTGSAKKKKEEQPKTAISETKKTLKDSFEKLIGVGAVDKPAEETKPAATKQAKAEKPVKKKAAPPAPKPKRITARKYLEEEEAQLEKDRGGVAKGKNVLKESFKTLVTDDKKKALAE
jgi:hypothetical protein